MLLQAGTLKARLQDLEKLLARFDCRSGYRRQHHVREYLVRDRHEREHQGEDTLPNALEDFLAIQGIISQRPLIPLDQSENSLTGCPFQQANVRRD